MALSLFIKPLNYISFYCVCLLIIYLTIYCVQEGVCVWWSDDNFQELGSLLPPCVERELTSSGLASDLANLATILLTFKIGF